MADRPASLQIVVDDRERASGLAAELAQLWRPVLLARLPIGDVEIGPRVLVERKTVADFAASLEDGRLFDQAVVLSRAAERPLMVIEGDRPIEVANFQAKALRGVLLALMAGLRIPVLRTESAGETAVFLAQLAAQETRRAGKPPEDRRSREVRAALDVLGAIPGVGDGRARKLLEAFGSVQEVVNADDRALRDARGIGPATASAIRRAMRSPAEGPTAGPSAE